MNIDRIIAIVSILIGCAVSYWFYRKGTKEKIPTWYMNAYNLIQDNASNLRDLKIIFRGKEVKNISVSKIMFWNAGKETIDASDVSATNPLTIVCSKNDYILDVSILRDNSKSINPSIKFLNESNNEYKNTANLYFDYLDYKKGFIIQVIHTNINKKDITIEGEIKGVDSIKRLTINKNNKKLTYLITLINIIAIIYNLFVNDFFKSLLEFKIPDNGYIFSTEYFILMTFLVLLCAYLFRKTIDIKNLSSLPFEFEELRFEKENNINMLRVDRKNKK